MTVQYSPELKKKLADLAALTGRSADSLIQDAVAGMLDQLATARTVLDTRYHDIESGRVRLIPGDEAFAWLRERIDARRT